ncbi:glycerophosphodiester phosphodiesterase [Persephonella sp.]
MNIKEALERKPFSIIGHRGAAGVKPENTISAVKFAIEVGADIVEVDVRSTSDGHLILSHDPDFKRVAGIDKRVSELDLNYIREHVRIKGEPVPLLEDILKVAKDKVGVFIEIKEPETTEKIVSKVKEHNIENQVCFISFYEEALSLVKKIDKNLYTGIIYSRPPGKIIEAKKMGAELVLPGHWLATEKAVKFAHKLKLKVVSWVINDEENLKKMVSNGVDGVASDYPDMIVKVRDKF